MESISRLLLFNSPRLRMSRPRTKASQTALLKKIFSDTGVRSEPSQCSDITATYSVISADSQLVPPRPNGSTLPVPPPVRIKPSKNNMTTTTRTTLKTRNIEAR